MLLALRPTLAVKALAVLALASALTACCGIPVKGRDGTTHYLVIGVGLVSVPKQPSSDEGVTASKIQALGIVANGGPNVRITAGYLRAHAVSIPADANVIVEQSDSVGGPLKIISTSAKENEE